MKCNKKMFLAIVTLFGFSVCLFGIPCTAFSQDVGIILVAHKATNENWNDKVKQLLTDITDTNQMQPVTQPVRLAFINYDEDSNQERSLRNALEELMVREGKEHILLIPLSPFSWIFNKRVRNKAQEEADDLAGPNHHNLPYSPTIKIAPALDYRPIGGYLPGYRPGVLRMLKECVDGRSHSPRDESLLLVGYGPCDDRANNALLRKLGSIGSAINNQVQDPFQKVDCINLRPHCPDPKISAQAVVDLREKAQELKDLNENGLVIVVPYVIQGDFQAELESYLVGIVKPGQICDPGIISHLETKAWLDEVIGRRMMQPSLPLQP